MVKFLLILSLTFTFSVLSCVSTQIPAGSPETVIFQGGFAFNSSDTIKQTLGLLMDSEQVYLART